MKRIGRSWRASSAAVLSGVVWFACSQGDSGHDPFGTAGAQGTYVVFKGNGVGCPMGQGATAVKIGATAPPKPAVAWCARQGGSGSPMVTTTDGRSDAIVWTSAAESWSASTAIRGP